MMHFDQSARTSDKKWPLILIAVLAFGIRYAITFESNLPSFVGDSDYYFDMAVAILKGQPISYFPNGYPLLIAGFLEFFDRAGTAYYLLWINAVLSTLTVLLTYKIAAQIYHHRIAILAAALICVWPNQLNYVRQLLTEAPSTFILVFAIFLAKRYDVISGFMFWLASLFRSTLSPIAFLFSAYLALTGEKRRAVLILAGYAIGVSINSMLVYFGVVAPSANLGFNFLVSIDRDSISGISFSIDHFSDYEKLHPVQTYLRFALSHPGEFLYQRFASLWELWGPWPQRGSGESRRSIITCILIGLRTPVLLMALAELWHQRANRDFMLFAILIFSITIVHTAFFSTARFSYNAEPVILILAAAWIYRRLVAPLTVRYQASR